MPTAPEARDNTAGSHFERLVEIMRILRSPTGCPWDREQTVSTLRPFVLEEAYEVVDAIDRQDWDALRAELGDLTLEVVFLAQLCAEDERFTVADALDAVTTKLIRRHPHVFGDDADATTMSAGDVKRRWEEIKADEQKDVGRTPSLLGGIPDALPSLLRADRIGKRAATVGFDWERHTDVLSKVREELEEVEQAADDHDHVTEEIGDLLFSVVNLARHLGVEPEGALRGANRKFCKRFDALEQHFQQRGQALRDVEAEDMDRQWNVIKRT